MRTTFISTRAMTEFTRLTLIKSQSQMAKAAKEAQTFRHADVGLAIGYKTGQTVGFRQDYERITAIFESNQSVATRMKVSQTALTDMKKMADDFLSTSISVMSSVVGTQAATEQGKAFLNTLSDRLNASYEGAYVFGGLNSDVAPLPNYVGGAAQAQVQAQFALIGTTPGVPSSITPAQMKTFLDTTFSNIFSGGVGGGWDTYSTNASSTNIKSRISTTEMIDTSVNATEAAFRQLAMGFVALSDLSVSQLTQETQKVVAAFSKDMMSAAGTGLANLQATLASPEQRVADANDRIEIQKDILNRRIFDLEGVDENEASLRLKSLETQLNLSYAITGKIQNLSILQYL